MLDNIPAHIGIIPDGNRRFAKRLMENPSKGHEWGTDKVKTLFDWCKDLGIKTITVYSLSIENFHSRGEAELEFLFGLARREIGDIIDNPDNFVHKNKIRMNFIGKLEMLPKDLQDKIKKAKEMTRGYGNYLINFALAYGGRQEIVDASKDIAQRVLSGELRPEEINESVVKHSLYTNGQADPDLIIRTGAEKRISNFMLFQSAYSEFAFLDVFWPELTKEDFYKAIEDYSKRNRRFGK
jgi:tritrans,polycis-undecaprenyl-diphosphate synthase [geranylgeranyl-diphosphate specific]